MDCLRLTILFSTLLFWAVPAAAATVAIVRPARATPALTETLSRLHGELLSVGLEVVIADRPATRQQDGTDARAWIEEVAAAHGALAVIDILGDTGPLAVDVWLIDKMPGRLEVSRVAVEPDTPNASEKLAIRAIEVLRSSFLEIDLAARGRRGEPGARSPDANLSENVVNQPARHPERIGFEVGAAALTSLDGVGTALLPILRVGWAASSRFAVQAALAGLGSRPTVAAEAGHARVAQQYGVLGGCYRLRPGSRLRPLFSLAAGVLRTSVEGQPVAPRQGHSVDRWSALLEGSLGAALRLHGPYYLTLAAHVHVAEPYIAIHFANTVVATSGRPNLLLTLTLGAWL